MKINWFGVAFLYLVIWGVPFVEAANKHKVLRFEWEYEQPPEDIAGFRLYGADVSGGPYVPIVDIPWNEVSGGLSATRSVEAEDNTTSIKYFVLTAYDLEGNESGYSNEVFAIIDFEAPGEPYKFTVIVVPVTK